MTHVIAKAAGFYGHLRDPGERFEIPDDEELGQWMIEANKDGSPKQTKEQKAGKVAAPAVPPAPEIGSVPSSPPFKPNEIVYTVRHVPVGNFEVVDANGQRVGELFEAVKGKSGQSKAQAQAEADRLNASHPQASISPAQAAQVQEEPPASGDSSLPDA